MLDCHDSLSIHSEQCIADEIVRCGISIKLMQEIWENGQDGLNFEGC